MNVKAKNAKPYSCMLMYLILFGSFAVLAPIFIATTNETVQAATVLTYPTDRWQRLWSKTDGTILGESPDENNLQFNNNWGSGIVAYGLSDNIQFSSSRTINMPTSGTYTFKVGSDDGTKLWIDDVLVLNKWINRGYFEDSVTVNLATGNHRFKLDFYENAGSAQASFSYTSPTTTSTYPTDRWQRLWSKTDGTILGESPDENNLQFNNNWGSGIVAYGLSDNIQFSSSRTINMPTSGTYTFKVGSDDGTKLWIDDVLVLNKWINRGYFEDSVTVNLATGNHRFKLDFYENAGSAQASFSYTSPTTTSTYPTDRWQRLWSKTDGTILGESPDENNLQFNNNWGSGIVAYGLSDNIQFSSSRTINMPTSGTYTFKVGSDDGTKLWIDDVLVLNKWINRGYFEDSVTVNLATGNHRFKLDFYENAGSAQASFSYTSPTTTSTYISPTSSAFKTALTAWGISGRLSNSYIQFMAKFDLVSTDYRITNIAELKALNPDIIVLGYRDMMLMQDNLPDWSTVNANENWFYHYANGQRAVLYNVGGYGFNNYVMDPGSVGWRNYFASYTKQAIINAGMDGLFIDDVWTDWANPDIYGLIVPSWSSVHPENPDYHTVCKNFLSYVKSQFGSLLVVSNGPDNYDYPITIDGKYGENFLTMFDAARDINALSTLSTAGKYYVAFGRNSDQNSMMYCLSGFLLAANGPNTYFSQGDFFSTGPGFAGWYPEFETLQKIGQATGAYYYSQNIYMRDFSNGKVLFNPTANSYSVSLGTTYINPTTNQQITQVQIPAWSGIVLTR